ncbi:MAG: ribonucleoprotein [Nitrosopumilus sp.]|nr:ribonucleoprotein [Nitrosopumilus sp.]
MGGIPSMMDSCRGRRILLRMRDGGTIRGTLADYDMLMNISLLAAEEGGRDLGDVLIRGDNIVAVAPDGQ